MRSAWVWAMALSRLPLLIALRAMNEARKAMLMAMRLLKRLSLSDSSASAMAPLPNAPSVSAFDHEIDGVDKHARARTERREMALGLRRQHADPLARRFEP